MIRRAEHSLSRRGLNIIRASKNIKAAEILQSHASMLDRPARINQLRPNDSNARTVPPAHQLSQPIGIDDFDIVIEKQQEITPRGSAPRLHATE